MNPDAADADVSGQPASKPYLTWLVAAACVCATLVTYVGARQPLPMPAWVWMYLRPTPEMVWAGRPDALLFAGLTHGTPGSLWMTAVHLGFNLLLLLQVGPLLEQALSPARWVVFAASAVVVGACAELALSSAAPIGISGVLYAMFGLMWAGRMRVTAWRRTATRRVMMELVGWGLFSWAASMLLHWPIANAAHAGGLLYGLAVGWLIAEERRPAPGALLSIALGVLVICALSWMPWSGRWCQWRGGRDLAAGRPIEAAFWLRRAIALGERPVPGWLLIREAERQRGNALGVREAESELRALGVRVGVPAPMLPWQRNADPPPLRVQPHGGTPHWMNRSSMPPSSPGLSGYP